MAAQALKLLVRRRFSVVMRSLAASAVKGGAAAGETSIIIMSTTRSLPSAPGPYVCISHTSNSSTIDIDKGSESRRRLKKFMADVVVSSENQLIDKYRMITYVRMHIRTVRKYRTHASCIFRTYFSLIPFIVFSSYHTHLPVSTSSLRIPPSFAHPFTFFLCSFPSLTASAHSVPLSPSSRLRVFL